MQIKLGKKLTLSPLYLAYLGVFVVVGKPQLVVFALVSVLLHELFHAIAARHLGYGIGKIELLPYGAALSLEERICPKDVAFIAVAGPIANVLLLLATVTLWWIMPQGYSFTLPLAKQNVALIVVNILPCYPLDGGRILSGIFPKAKKLCTLLTPITGGVFVLLFLLSCFFKINFTLLVFGIFLLAYFLLAPKEESFCYRLQEGIVRPHRFGKLTTFTVHKDTPIFRLLRQLAEEPNTEFLLILDKERIIISRAEVIKLAEKYGASQNIGEAFFSR